MYPLTPPENDEAITLDIGGSLATGHVHDTAVNGHVFWQIETGRLISHTQTQMAGIHQTHI